MFSKFNGPARDSRRSIEIFLYKYSLEQGRERSCASGALDTLLIAQEQKANTVPLIVRKQERETEARKKKWVMREM